MNNVLWMNAKMEFCVLSSFRWDKESYFIKSDYMNWLIFTFILIERLEAEILKSGLRFFFEGPFLICGGCWFVSYVCFCLIE